ncbi:E3 ubiquitin-protein ligase RNF170 isoform X2 [Microcaecilia unicolor]|uniref:E3 ubiquitin-protein ligase RNF170-like isoform X2 n=1 Tax=Microcaecilia unicolor TaxID=1415580 RepID=A0A6P7Y0M5_9AMPH|nr:E3 ubiquitin-protein ligase RNF170-like isoform X2 [Microcaecilia unicolor]
MLPHTFSSSSETRFVEVKKKKTNYQQKDKENWSSATSRESIKPRQPCYHSDLNCPVCLQTATFPVETNCGHLFCGSCLISYWKHGSWLGAVSCPLCRQKVIALYNLFHENQQEKHSKQIGYDIRDYNKRFSGQPRPHAITWHHFSYCKQMPNASCFHKFFLERSSFGNHKECISLPFIMSSNIMQGQCNIR